MNYKKHVKKYSYQNNTTTDILDKKFTILDIFLSESI